jgi:molecular chaperone GrpE
VEDHDTRAPSTQRSSAVIESATPTLAANGELAVPPAEESDWQSLALLLRADMDNFRKRQSRRADDAVVAERERLLRLILPVADNLARALSYDVQGDGTLRRGVELTQRELMRLLEAEGVTRIETVGQPFTPELHEAVAAVAADVKAGTVVKEVESGYQLGERLLRPARVVVAA